MKNPVVRPSSDHDSSDGDAATLGTPRSAICVRGLQVKYPGGSVGMEYLSLTARALSITGATVAFIMAAVFGTPIALNAAPRPASLPSISVEPASVPRNDPQRIAGTTTDPGSKALHNPSD